MAAPHSSRTGVWLALALGAAGGCTAYSTLKSNVSLDCSITNAYDFKIIDHLNQVTSEGQGAFWTSADHSDAGAASMSAQGVALTDGARCGETAALEITGAHNDDWGSLSGYNNLGTFDASAYEGLSFWARSPGPSSKSFTVLLADPNCYNPATDPTPPTAYCTNYSTDGGTSSTGVVTDPSTGMVLSSGTLTAPPLPDACTNYYQAVVTVTAGWQLYTIPFGQFQQTAEPNRVPNTDLTVVGTAPGTALLTSALKLLDIRFPRESVIDLQLSDLGVYRRASTTDAGADGAVDAAQP
ncbi:MAG TPA: hypothetical protein VHG72_03040 [Polyangia bacterium]|nr:hypothetical protein [Polyangia bacterium]